MRNEEYWKRRQAEKLDDALKNAVVDIEEVKSFYHKAYLYTDKQIEGMFESYRNHHITDSVPMSEREARELLNNLVNDHDYAELKRKLENNPSSSAKKELLKKLDAPAYQARINRLMELQNKLDDLMRLDYNLEKEKSTDAYLKGIYDGYYRNVFNISKGIGIAYDFSEIDPELVNLMLKSTWHDKNYSKRIWENAQNLGNELKDQLMLGVIMGKTNKEMSKTLQDKFAAGASNCERLVRTEMAAFINSIDLVNFKDAGIEKEMFIAVHDSRTSKICQRHDRSIINVQDAKIGVNVPPLHPNCRSHMIPYIEGITDNMKKRQRNPITGKDEVVDVKESYDQWLKRQQEEHGVDAVDIYIKKKKNLKKVELIQNYRPVTRSNDSTLFQYSENVKIIANKIMSYNDDVYVSEKVHIKPMALHRIEAQNDKILKEYKIKSKPKIVIFDINEYSGAYGKYDAVENTVYYCSDVLSKDVRRNGDVIRRELWHMKQAEKYRNKFGQITNDNYHDYIKYTYDQAKVFIDDHGITEYNVGEISNYAEKMFAYSRYDEVEAEYISLLKKRRKK